MLDTLRHEDFTKVVGARFTARCGAQSVSVELEEARLETRSASAPGATRKPFSLMFRGPENVSFEQGLVAFSHPDLPTLEVLATPVGCTAGRILLQVVFN